jgi:hypothetical protein
MKHLIEDQAGANPEHATADAFTRRLGHAWTHRHRPDGRRSWLHGRRELRRRSKRETGTRVGQTLIEARLGFFARFVSALALQRGRGQHSGKTRIAPGTAETANVSIVTVRAAP